MSAVSVPLAAPSFLERLILRVADATAAGIRRRVEQRVERRWCELDRIRERQARGYDPAELERAQWLLDARIR